MIYRMEYTKDDIELYLLTNEDKYLIMYFSKILLLVHVKLNLFYLNYSIIVDSYFYFYNNNKL